MPAECIHGGCTKRPNFNHPGQTGGKFCSEHKREGMVDVRSKRCAHDGCTSTSRVFNHPGETKGMFCGEHKEPGMVDVASKQCAHDGCTTRPNFNHPGETGGMFCSEHKREGMVDVVRKQCAHDGCTTRPNFNHPGEAKGMFCGEHKREGMVDVVSKTCAHEGCTTQPHFNHPGQTGGKYCREHKEPEMVDVVHKHCAHEGCDTIIHGTYAYGLPGSAPTHCAQHKLAGMMRQPKRKCTAQGCNATSTHGITQPERCEKHAMPLDENLVEMRCQVCYDENGQVCHDGGDRCPMVDILNADGVCSVCAPMVGNKRPRHPKQREVQQFLDVCVKEHPYTSTDKTPIDVKACGGLERPDFLWDRSDRIVILEVDEDQHFGRPCECEQARMMNISQAIGCEKTVWLRYNPDSFKSPESRKWGTKAKRHAVLRQWLEWALTVDVATLPYTITVIYLFFDGFTTQEVEQIKLL
jgi:hypothetical protein